jgi:hypothetical protein
MSHIDDLSESANTEGLPSNTEGSDAGQAIQAASISSITVFGSVSVSVRSYFSRWYLWAALHHARLAAELESEADRFPITLHHRSHVITAITSAVTFLEATVNEVFQDVVDGYESVYTAPLSSRTRELMSWYWNERGEKASILQKYVALLEFADAPSMERGAEPYQSTELLIRLRNYLIHFKPQNVGGGLPAVPLAPSLMRLFQASHVPDNALMKPGVDSDAWFPNRALGAGCAAWAPRAAKSFADSWRARLELDLAYHVAWEEQP